MIGKLVSLARDLSGDYLLTVKTKSDPREMFDQLKDFDVRFDFKKFCRHRSLEANACAWAMIDKIAEVKGISKVEVYRNAVRDIGGVSQFACVQTENLDRMIRWWEAHGLGWQAEPFPSKIDGCTNVIFYCGSSEYDSRQMSQLIDHLIQDAESLGIPTITEKEAEKMLGRWRKKKEDSLNAVDHGKDHSAVGSGVSEEEYKQLPQAQ